MEIIVEQITRGKKVVSYVKLNSDKIRIGRAYDNDIVLQEEHVNPYHAELDIYPEDNVIVLTDLDSVNGIKTEKGEPVKASMRVKSGDIFSLGKTYIRVLNADHEVAPAKEMSVLEDLAGRLNQWYFAAGAIVVFWFSLMLEAFFTRFDTVIWSKEAAQFSMASLILLFVPAVMAVSARFFKKEVRFFASCAFCFVILLLFQMSSALDEWLFFNWPESSMTMVAIEVIELVLTVSLLWGIFYLASNLTMKKITATSIFLVLGSWGLVFYSKQNDTISLYPNSYVVVLPNELLIAESQFINNQNATFDNLFKQASEEARALNKEGNE